MYTSHIGKKFLDLYNLKTGSDYDAETFFDKVFFDLFFNDERHLMHVHGSSFFQKVSKDSLGVKMTKELFRLQRLKNDIDDERVSGSTFVGYAAEKIEAVTSGQVSNISVNIDKNEMYASWIGEGLSLGVHGRYQILIDDEYILWTLYKGWITYRKYLSQTPNFKDKEISFWNAKWLIFSIENQLSGNKNISGISFETESSNGQTRISKTKWSELVYVLSSHFGNREILFYCYRLDKTNTTLGFVKAFLNEVQKPIEFLKRKYGINKYQKVVSETELRKFDTFYNFHSACRMGTIGLKALEPAKLREYMPRGSTLFARGKEFKFNNEQSFYLYEIYQIWIMAMLNKTELLELAGKIAGHLIELENKDTRGKTVLSTLSNNVRESNNLKAFIANISETITELPEYADDLKNVVKEVLGMPSDNFPLFITLIRFEYNYQKTKN